MSRRSTSDDEKKLFRKTVEDSRPQVIAKAKAKKAAAKGKPASIILDGNTAERLKGGRVAPQARIDLHGYTEDAAHAALLNFLRCSQKSGLKLTLVITGKGNPKTQDDGAAWTMRAYGVLKEMVPRWLSEPEFAALIAGIQKAHVRHGGGGALYVYLRKLR